MRQGPRTCMSDRECHSYYQKKKNEYQGLGDILGVHNDSLKIGAYSFHITCIVMTFSISVLKKIPFTLTKIFASTSFFCYSYSLLHFSFLFAEFSQYFLLSHPLPLSTVFIHINSVIHRFSMCFATSYTSHCFGLW